ncbi:MAG: DUF6159 family protein [Candidatus Thermoplasmatota archaeon]
MKVKVPFRERWATSRAILSQSLTLLRKRRDLWVFPILASVTMMVAVAVPAGTFTLWGRPLMEAWGISSTLLPLVLFVVLLPILYPASLFASLLNAALCFAAHEEMGGKTITRAEAWKRARSAVGPLARFNLVALLVAGIFQVIGVLLDKLRIVPYIGAAVQTVGMMGWAVASFFVIPILVVEREASAMGALRASTDLARSQWGKATAGLVTIGLVLMVPILLLGLILIGLTFPLMLLAVKGGNVLAGLVPLFILLGVYLAVVMLLSGLGQAASVLYQTGLYRYARTGKVAKPYTTETLVDAWAPYRQP